MTGADEGRFVLLCSFLSFIFFIEISGNEMEEDSLIYLTGERRNTIIAIGKGNRAANVLTLTLRLSFYEKRHKTLDDKERGLL